LSIGGGSADRNKIGGSKKANALCSSVCQQRRKKRSESVRDNANLLNTRELVQQVSAAKDRLLDKLRKDYGDYFEPLFVDEETGNYRPFGPVTEDGPSLERLKRKLTIKVLSMQLTLDHQDSDFHGCDCSGGKDQALRNDVVDSLDPEDSSAVFEGINGTAKHGGGVFEKYVWATGGHSAAAGHGNLYNETYTSYMASDLKDIFGSIGIDFEGRNYAMGNTQSGTVVSMCWKEIFGEDVDFFAWDYGVMDGKQVQNLLHYSYRGALSPSRPALMMMGSTSSSTASRLQIVQGLEEMGVAVFFGNQATTQVMRNTFPDSSGLSMEDINALPEYVRNYRCGDGHETGEPFCRTDKYSKWGCSPRLAQTSWHPGFKEHALIGHALALFLTDVLLGTLQDLLSEHHQFEENTLLLSQLQQEDIDLHNNFTNAELPELHKVLVNLTEVKVTDTEPKIDASLFFKGRSMCHTARLPSQARYHGILTDPDEVGQPAPVGEETYYVGVEDGDAKETATENSEIRIVYTVYRERETNCQGVLVKPDHPDYFFTSSLDGWTTLTFPNDAEKQFYGYDPSQHEGIIIIHWKVCDVRGHPKCPVGVLKAVDLSKEWIMKINGQTVSKMIDIGSVIGLVDRGNEAAGPFMVKGENGFRFVPDSNGQYKIEIKVTKEDHFLQLQDFVLY